MGWMLSRSVGVIGSRLSGREGNPLSSGWNRWQSALLPSKRGRCSPRCQPIDRSSDTHHSSAGAGMHARGDHSVQPLTAVLEAQRRRGNGGSACTLGNP